MSASGGNTDRKRRHQRVSRRAIMGAGIVLSVTSLATGPAAAQGWLEDLLGGLLRQGERPGPGGLTLGEATAGLREALSVASVRTIDRVGRPDGYFRDRAIHIPLPGVLGTAQSVLSAVGSAGLLDDLELRLNRSAEQAAPQARNIFFDAIETMTIEDAFGILQGPDDSATRYFQRRMTPDLTTAFRPIISGELADAGAFTALENLVSNTQARMLAPAVGDYARADLVDHGLTFSLDGIFYYLAREEATIRNDPLARSTDLLRRVFG